MASIHLIETKDMLVNGSCFIFVLTIAVTISAPCYSQGSWNLEYVTENEIDSSFLGREVRLDFKNSPYDSIESTVNIIALLSVGDTVSLEFNSLTCRFVEYWEYYADHGALADQKLICIDSYPCIRTINELFLERISDSRIVVGTKDHILIEILRLQIKGMVVSMSD